MDVPKPSGCGRLLVVSYAYPPLASARALRWSAIAEHWAGRGWEVDVVCAWKPGAASEEIRNGVTVRRAHVRALEPLASLVQRALGAGATGLPGVLPGAGAGTGVGVGPREATARRAILVAAKWLHDRTWGAVRWPDYAWPWFTPALAAAVSLTRARRYSALYTVSHPFTSHLVGAALRRLRPIGPWVLDVGDPWSFSPGYPMNNDRLYRRLNRATEHRVFSMGDRIAVTHQASLEAFRQRYPDLAAKLRVVPPLAPPVTSPGGGSPLPPADGRIQLVYVGSLFRTIRSPELLLEICARLVAPPNSQPVDLHFFGDSNDCAPLLEAYRDRLGGRLHVHGRVPAAEARRAVDAADVLVNIGNLTTYQVPSKMAEYASTGKPILNIAYHEGDSSALLLDGYPALHTVYASRVAGGQEYLSEVQAFLACRPRLSREQRAQWAERFGVRSVAAAYLGLAGLGESGGAPADAGVASAPEAAILPGRPAAALPLNTQ